MSEIIVPENFYQQRIESLSAILISLNKRKNWLGWLRLFIFIIGAAVLYITWPLALWASLLIIFFILIPFLIVLNKDFSNRDAISHHERLLELNKQEVLHLQHQFSHEPDGDEFFDEEDSYAGDLDIFGRSSMYQYINRSCSQQGNKLLANWLMNAAVEAGNFIPTKSGSGIKPANRLATGTTGPQQYFCNKFRRTGGHSILAERNKFIRTGIILANHTVSRTRFSDYISNVLFV